MPQLYEVRQFTTWDCWLCIIIHCYVACRSATYQLVPKPLNYFPCIISDRSYMVSTFNRTLWVNCSTTPSRERSHIHTYPPLKGCLRKWWDIPWSLARAVSPFGDPRKRSERRSIRPAPIRRPSEKKRSCCQRNVTNPRPDRKCLRFWDVVPFLPIIMGRCEKWVYLQ